MKKQLKSSTRKAEIEYLKSLRQVLQNDLISATLQFAIIQEFQQILPTVYSGMTDSEVDLQASLDNMAYGILHEVESVLL